MDILYTCNDNYVWLMGISCVSLFENNKNLQDLNVYLIGEHISEISKNKLYKIASDYNRNIYIIDAPQLEIPDVLVSTRWPYAAFMRLFSAQILPSNITKILYLDCDTIINGEISELIKIDISGKIALGVRDCISELYRKNIGLSINDFYINAGVILFNLEELRKININDKIQNYMKKFGKLINYADQDLLNGIFKKQIGVMKANYNVMTIDLVYDYKDVIKLRKPTEYYSEQEFECAKKEPLIIHYTTNMRTIRPWYSNTNHPMAEKFELYKNKSPWGNIEYQKKIFSDKQNVIVGVVQKLPNKIGYSILGFVHAQLKPMYIRIKAGL